VVVILVLVVLLVAIDLFQLPQGLNKFHMSLLHSLDHFEHKCHLLWSTSKGFPTTEVMSTTKGLSTAKNLSATESLSATQGIFSPKRLSTTLSVCLSHGMAVALRFCFNMRISY
jgi:hypothetical protein